MRAARIASVVAILLVGLVGSAMAQRINTPGSYEANACIAPGLLGGGFDPGFPALGPDVYHGTVTIAQEADGSFEVQFKGERSDGAKALANATFEPGWAGFLRGNLIIGAQTVSNCITRIDVANLRRANLNGVVHVNGVNRRFIAIIGAGGTLIKQFDVPPPARFR